MRIASALVAALVAAIPAFAAAATLDNEKATHASLSGVTMTLTGRSELHITGGGDPIPGCTVHLNSEDAWLFFHSIAPSVVASNLLSRVRVNGAAAVADSSVRVVQFVNGAVVIPQPSNYQPLTVFSDRHLAGASMKLSLYTEYDNEALGSFADGIRSFVLKRGFTATLASNENGAGYSRNYVAQDSDIEISILPSALDCDISFVRVFPWRWVTKKGSCDVSPGALNAKWRYNWNIDRNSTRDWEYVAIKQQPYWPGLNQNWEQRGVNHLLGFNEPDNPVEDAYQNLSPPGSVSNAIARWPELLATGLRVGAPAVTDGGYNWIRGFIDRAEAAGHRVDYVPVHYYRSYWNKDDPQGAANQMHDFLRSIHDMAQRPIWVTEFNNGANWTDNSHDPNTTQNRNAIQAMINMMDSTPWIERYAIFSRVEWFRQTHYDDGGITPMGAMYRDHKAPIAYQQTVANSGTSGNAAYAFEGHVRDTLSGNNAMIYGTPKFVPGRYGSALSFDGTDDYLALPARLGDSGDFSFAAWVRWSGGGEWQRVFDLGNGTNNYMYLTPRSNANTLRFGLRVGGTQHQLNAAALTPGVWTHVAVTINGNVGKIFVNGSVVNTNNGITLRPHEVNSESNYLGKSQWTADPLFSGLLDEVRFFTAGLSDAEVSALAVAAPPEFVSSPALHDATVGLPFTVDLNDLLAAASGAVTFSKVAGPAWLAVSADGSVVGVPGLADVGGSELVVRAASSDGALSFAQIPVVVAAGDPVAWYPFESSSAAGAGSAPAVLVGGAGYAQGLHGQALSFDGSDDHAVLPAGIASGNEITFAAWVRWNGGGTWQRIFDFGNGTESYLVLTPRSGSNTMRFAIRNGGSEQTLETLPLAVGVWTHVAVTLGEDGGRLFRNGSLVASNASMSLRPSDFRPAANYLGRSQFSADPTFGGVLDDVHIFHRALSAAEINELRTSSAPIAATSPIVLPAATPGEPFDGSVAGSVPSGGVTFSKVGGPAWLTVEAEGRVSGIPSDADTGTAPFRIRATSSASPVLAADFDLYVPVERPADLRAHYEFDGATSDRTGLFDATPFGSPGYDAGWFDQAVELDGSDDYVRLPAGLVTPLTDVTIAARFRWDGGGSWQRVFDFGNNTTQYLFLTPRSGSGTMRFSITVGGGSTEQRIETDPAPVGEWTHAAVVLEGTTGTLYVNGAAAASGVITLDPADVAPALNYLGKSQWPDPAFNGAIDDFRIFDRALDAGEVKALAVPPPPQTVPRGYDSWAAAIPFPLGEDAPDDDPDRDRLANLIEWLIGSDPLGGASGEAPAPAAFTAAQIGLPDDAKTYLGFTARIRKDRPGVTLIPEAAATVAALDAPAAAASASQAGPPVDDGAYEIFTWHYEVPIEDTAAGFIRLRVVME